MLKPIHRVACSPALAACQQLMQRFALWLCDPATTGAHISQQGLRHPVLASEIEANWLWEFLQRTKTHKPIPISAQTAVASPSEQNSLLSRAKTVAAMSPEHKKRLAAWIKTVSALATQFQPAPTLWPIKWPDISASDWKAFKTLMEAFYEKGFRSGLPYLPDGTPTAAGGVTYAKYVEDFRYAHRLNHNPNSREVCVLCGGHLGDTPHVDHWIIKSEFPLLSVCADNLSLICSTCNEAPNKGDKPVHSNGSFADWFHPYLRPGNGAVRMDYELTAFSVQCSAVTLADELKAAKLDALLNLSARWTREFKAEYVKHQDILRRREQRRLKSAQARHTLGDILSYVQEWHADLVASEPHYEVYQILSSALQEQSRLAAWQSELGLV